jgi:hypothetical protein
VDTEIKEPDGKVYLPLDEVKEFLLSISNTMEGIVHGIKTSLERIEQGENNDDNDKD